MSVPVLEARAVSRLYGAVHALERVTLALQVGTVTGLMGDNGAGKSTLVRILAGVIQPTAGSLLLDGAPVHFPDPRTARAHGVMTVYQDLALAPLLSVWRNFVLGAEPLTGRFQRLDVASARARARAELDRFGFALDVDRPVGRLSGGERQAVAIARAIHYGARVLILDEPTAALAVPQVERVLATIATARQRGTAILLITHNPQHALAVADQLVVLRQGRVVAQPDPRTTDVSELTRIVSDALVVA
jgi:simple sugar transport system ATP-binding protein